MSEFTIRAGDEVTFVRTSRIEGGSWTRLETGIAVGFKTERADGVNTEILVRLAADEHLRIGVDSVRRFTPLHHTELRCHTCGASVVFDVPDHICHPCANLKQAIEYRPWIAKRLLLSLTSEPVEEVYIGSDEAHDTF